MCLTRWINRDVPAAAARLGCRRAGLVTPVMLATVVIGVGGGCKGEPPAVPATQPAPPASAEPAASRPADTRAAATRAAAHDWTYLDIVRAAHPAALVAEPLTAPVALDEAARVLLTDPVHVDEVGHLWLTRAGEAATEAVLKAAADRDADEHVVGDRVLFAWWVRDKGDAWTPHLVVPAAGGGVAGSSVASGVELVGPARRQLIGRRDDYRWDRARSWSDAGADRLAVPTPGGVAVFTYRGPREPVAEAYHDFGIDAAAAGVTGAAVAGGATRPLTATTPAGAAAPATRTLLESAASEPQFLFAPGGLLAWVPPPPGGRVSTAPDTSPGGAPTGVARFANGAWSVLAQTDGWPPRPLHLIPLRDGSVTQLVADGAGVKLEFTALPALATPTAAAARPAAAAAATDPTTAPAVADARAAVLALLDKLADDDPKVREDAFAQLSNFGPGLLPILRDIPERDLPPQARSAVRGLLRKQATPMLGGLGVRGEHLRVAGRLRDGGLLLYTADGVTFPNPAGDEPLRVAPAWVAARPGRAVEVLPPALTADVSPEAPNLDVVGGRWVVTTDARGPRLFGAGLFRNLLKADDAAYTHVVGVDRRGRWLLRRPADAAAAVSTAAPPRPVPTLVVDPTLPNFTPRLPVWVFDNSPDNGPPGANAAPGGNAPPAPAGDGAVGWDRDGWPAVRQGPAELRLLDGGWAPLADGDKLLTEVPPEAPTAPRGTVPPADGSPPASAPATIPRGATGPAAAQAAELPSGLPLFVDAQGTRYFDGVDRLTLVARDGRRVDWPLPGTAVGQAPVRLVGTADGRLFLFNQPGRVLRLRPTPGGGEPFVVEKAFTRNIPSGESPRRIWLDPAGRIVLALEHKLVILFPSGYIPQAIREKMADPPGEDD